MNKDDIALCVLFKLKDGITLPQNLRDYLWTSGQVDKIYIELRLLDIYHG